MIGTDTPAGDTALVEFFVIHVGTFSGEVGSNSVGGTSTFVTVPFGGIVFTDPADDVIGFLSDRAQQVMRYSTNTKGMFREDAGIETRYGGNGDALKHVIGGEQVMEISSEKIEGRTCDVSSARIPI